MLRLLTASQTHLFTYLSVSILLILGEAKSKQMLIEYLLCVGRGVGVMCFLTLSILKY